MDFYAKFFLLRQLVARNIQLRFKGSILGWLWSFLIPLLMLVVYTIVFGNFFKSRWGADASENKMAFAVALFSGISFYNIFGESVSISTSTIVDNVNYVKKVRFPLEFLPLSQVLSTTLLTVPWIILLLGSTAVIFKNVSFVWFLLPLGVLPLIFFAAGCALFVASLGVYFRDIQYVIGVLLQMLFFLSPVFYRFESLPVDFQKMLQLNPMVWFINLNRKIVFINSLPGYNALPSGMEWFVPYAIAAVTFFLGFTWFTKTKRGFSDVL